MKETALTDRIPQHIIQHAYDVLRNDGFGTQVEPVIVVAYLLTYLRAGYPLHRFLEGDSSLPPFITNPKGAGKLSPDELLQDTAFRAINTAESVLHQLRRPSLHRLLELLAPLRLPAMAQPEYAALFDYALDHPFSSLSRSAGQYMMPLEVVQFIAQVFFVHPTEKIYNPFAGTCQLASFLPAETHYSGQEPSQQVQALGMLRLTAHRLHSATITAQDPLHQWPDYQPWDIILTTAPIFDFRSRETAANGTASTTRADTAFVERVLQSLTEGGRAVIPVTSSFLWRSDRTQRYLRQQLVESGYLQAVIELPIGLLSGASINFSLLLIHKLAGRANSPIWFLDATPHVDAQRNVRHLDVDALLQTFRNKSENEHCQLVATSRLAANEYNLSAHRYLVPEEHHPDDVKLGDIAELLPRGQPMVGLNGRFAGIRHLLGDSPDYQLNWHLLNWSALPLEILERPAARLSEDALLVAAQGGKLKPTWYVHDPAAQVVYAQSIYALRLQVERVDPEYLVTELNSEHVHQQLQAMQVGSTIPSLTRPDLLRLRVRLPELAQQRAIVDSLREQLIRQKQKELDALQANRAQKAESSQQFASLKHALGKPRMALVSAINRLERAVNRYAEAGTVLTMDSLVNPADPTVTVQHIFDSLKQARDFMTKTLARKSQQLVVEEHTLEPVELISFLRNLVTQANAKYPSFRITFEPSQELLLSETLLGRPSAHWVLANKHLLELAFDNILENANHHGFGNTWSEGNRVLIGASYGFFDDKVAPNINLWVYNNGTEFPLNFDPKRLFMLGQYAGDTGREGIGGHEVKEIFTYFGGKVEAVALRNSKEGYTVGYFINLPLAAAENTDPDVEAL